MIVYVLIKDDEFNDVTTVEGVFATRYRAEAEAARQGGGYGVEYIIEEMPVL